MALRKKTSETAEQQVNENAAAGAQQAASGQTVQIPQGRYDVGVRPAENHGKEIRAWKKRVKKARKLLRKDLKKKGIRSKGEFEQIAWELGLTIDDKKRGFWWWLRWRLRWLASHLGLGTLLAAAGVLLGGLFLLSYISDQAGAFTVNLTANMMKNGFVLCEEPEFNDPTSRLFSEKTKDINNITLSDIMENVDEIDGPHNGKNYIAYTFYIKNEGDEVGAYQYNFKIGGESLGVNDAVWIMLFEDGRQVVYAKTSADGDPEGLLGYDEEPPFYDMAYNQANQYYQKDGMWGLRTTAFADEESVVRGFVEHVEPNEVHKYSVVIWLEGNDPECTDEIFGGHAAYSMEFSIDDSQDRQSIFSGVWRTEYEDYMGIESVKTEEEPPEE